MSSRASDLERQHGRAMPSVPFLRHPRATASDSSSGCSPSARPIPDEFCCRRRTRPRGSTPRTRKLLQRHFRLYHPPISSLQTHPGQEAFLGRGHQRGIVGPAELGPFQPRGTCRAGAEPALSDPDKATDACSPRSQRQGRGGRFAGRIDPAISQVSSIVSRIGRPTLRCCPTPGGPPAEVCPRERRRRSVDHRLYRPLGRAVRDTSRKKGVSAFAARGRGRLLRSPAFAQGSDRSGSPSLPRTGLFRIVRGRVPPLRRSLGVIDFNPRMFSQVGMDIRRGMPLPLLACLDAVGDSAPYARKSQRRRRGRRTGRISGSLHPAGDPSCPSPDRTHIELKSSRNGGAG